MKRCLTSWTPSTLAAAVLLALLAAFPHHASAQSAGKLYNMGRAAEARNDVEEAYEDYAKAWHKKPSDERYKVSYERLRLDAAAEHVKKGEQLRDQGDDTGALTEFLRALEIDPSNELASQDIRTTRQKIDKDAIAPSPEIVMSPSERKALQDLGAPPQLKPLSSEPLSLHMVEDTKVIYQTVGKAAGINVLFDPDYHSSRQQVDLTGVSLFDALRILGTATGTFWRPITTNTIFVAQNTRGKRTELDEEAVQTFYLTNVAQQNDLNDIQTALRNVFTTAKLYGVPSQNAIIMRGTPDELLLAEKLINDLDKARAEVVCDIAVLEVSRDKLRNIGIQLPQTGSVNFQQSNANSTSSTSTATSTSSTSTTTSSLTLNNLAHLNSTNFAVSIGSATVNLLLSDTSTRILQNPRLRASDNQKASLKIGEKYPVATGSYQAGVATAITSSLVNTQFQYLDVGVNIDMTPTVHYDRDVSLKFKIEVSATDGTENLGGISEPIITQRVVEQVIRLREGEASILGGIFQHQFTSTISGTPGLGELPILKYLFSTQQKENTDSEIVFLLIPHVVRAADITPLNLRQVDTGTTNSIELRHTSEAGPDDAPAPQASTTNNPQLGASAAPGAGASTAVPLGAPSAAADALASMQQQQAASSTPVTFQLTPPPAPQAVGSTFKVPINLSGGSDVYSSWEQLQYDASKLSLVNVDVGDMLGKDGQPVALVHRDDGAGNVAISASRPPGVAGISGSGTVCTLTFQAKAAGDASIAISRPVVRNSKQQALDATGSQGVVHIR
jgi:general secretion pathway protein D